MFEFSYAHGNATLCMMSSPQNARVLLLTLKQVNFSHTRLKSLEILEEKWGCNSFLKSPNSIS